MLARRIDLERGVGAVSSVVGVTIFLALLFFAVQVLYNLYATSVVTAAAFDAARVVAGSDGGSDVQDDAWERACQVMGRYCDRVEPDWSQSTDDVVILRVVAENPNLLMRGLGTVAPFQTVDRTIRVRVERLR